MSESEDPAEPGEETAGNAGPPIIFGAAPERSRLTGKLGEFHAAFAELPERQQKFVELIMADPTNRTAAARGAGYSEKRASVTAHELMNNPKVAHCIALANNLRIDRTLVTGERTLHELAVIAYSDLKNYDIDFETGVATPAPGVPEYVTRAIQSVKVRTRFDEEGRLTRETEFKFWSKTDALRMLGLHQRLFGGGDPAAVPGTTNVNVQQNVWVFGDRKFVF